MAAKARFGERQLARVPGKGCVMPSLRTQRVRSPRSASDGAATRFPLPGRPSGKATLADLERKDDQPAAAGATTQDRRRRNAGGAEKERSGNARGQPGVNAQDRRRLQGGEQGDPLMPALFALEDFFCLYPRLRRIVGVGA